MTLIPWDKGQSLLWDFICTDTLAPSYVNSSSRVSKSAATLAAQRKTVKYLDLINQNYIFIPFAVETLGSWDNQAITFVNQLGSLLRNITSEPRSKSFLIQRISIAIQRGNAACVMGTFPQNSKLDELFYIL